MITEDFQRAVNEFRRHIGADDADADADAQEPAGEFKAAEYIIFSLALDTYIRHLEETIEHQLLVDRAALERFEGDEGSGEEAESRKRTLEVRIPKLKALLENPTDKVVKAGVALLRRLDRDLETFESYMKEHLPGEAHQKMLVRALRRSARSAEGAGRRALGLRTVLSRGGPQTVRGIFDTVQARKQIKVAIAASMLDNGDAALDLFAAMPAAVLRNPLIRKWLKWAADTAQPLTQPIFEDPEMLAETESGAEVVPGTKAAPPPNPVGEASPEAAEQAPRLLAQQALQDGSTGAEAVQEAQQAQQATLEAVEQSAAAAARAALEKRGDPDIPPTRSEVVGIATAAAVAAMSDPANPQNVPETLKGLDDEQRAAAVTDGRVLVAASAGSGKSMTLVARVNHLIRDRGVAAPRILVTSFNTDAAEELKIKLGRSAGADAAGAMQVGTMHSLFKRFILKYGTKDEKSAMRSDPTKTASMTARTVQSIWATCFDKDTMPTPPLKEVKQQMELWVGNNISVEKAKTEAASKKELIAAPWYEMYEGLKGALPNWEPPCEGKARDAADKEYEEKMRNWEYRGGRGKPPQRPMTSYEWYMSKMRPEGERLGDFNDMITMFRDLLQRNPAVRKEVQSLFDHICIDECQDLNQVQFDAFMMMSEHIGDGSDGKSIWMVGDDSQCVAADTQVRVAEKSAGVKDTVLAKDIKSGDCVLSYRNGKFVAQVVKHAKKSDWAEGFKIVTESGKTLTMSPNHKIWARAPELSAVQAAVYLMYRPDMGFRVGVTNKCYSEDYRNSFGGCAYQEKAERMWVLDICDDREDALFAEQSYALTYGIPTIMFEGANRGINQDRIVSLFAAFGENGVKLLKDRYLSFDLPHWLSQSYTKHSRLWRTVQMTAHGAKGTQVTLEWSGDDLDDKLDAIHFTQIGERRRVRKWFTNYRKALEFAKSLQSCAGANLSQRLSTDDGAVRLITASGLFPGMLVVTSDGCGDDTVLEAITSVEKVTDKQFIDLDVDDASNFIGGDILSHNSIYGFRGARPDLFQGLYEKEGWKTRMIRTSYRCSPEILSHANKLITRNEDRIPMEANANPARTRGQSAIEVQVPEDAETGAIDSVKHIIEMRNSDPNVSNSDFAVLARTNKELHAYEAACLIQGIPYARKGASSFLGSPEVKGMLGYVDLVMGTDNDKLQQSLADIINIPRRFWGFDMDQSVRVVKDALRDYARQTRMDLKSVNPVEALRSSTFRELLGKRLQAGNSGTRKYQDVMNQIGGLSDFIDNLQANADKPGFGVSDLFNEVLMIEGDVRQINPETGRAEFVTRSFRESIMVANRDRDDGDEIEADDEDDEETKGLGNISFLYELAKVDPNNPPDTEEDPSTPAGFLRKMDQLREQAKDLRIDVTKWKKEQQDKLPEERLPPPGVYLGTAHSVKGLQWSNVFVQMPKGKFPIELRAKPGELPPTEEEVEKHVAQERRLAYVALTRAKTNLTVVCPRQVGNVGGVSQFVGEAELEASVVSPMPKPSVPPEPEAAEVEPLAKPFPIREASAGWDPFDNGASWNPFEG